ncbi:MAG: threonine ammonia-lyase [Parasphingopyxis sp.]|nr:threonine ammonia-lyase [Sphingomonadales bacterium]
MASAVESETGSTLTIDDIRAAQERIAGEVVRTPTLESRTLSELTGAEVWLKFENHQFTASFKERGALNKLLQLTDEERKRGVIAASAGNHSQGVAFHGARLGIPVTIVMPQHTPAVKVRQTRDHGAEVVLHGERFDDAKARAFEIAADRGLVFVHPFDDREIAAGQGTAAIEMLEDAPEIDTLVVPIGGGGLISGMAVAAKAINPDIEVIGVEAELYPSTYAKLHGKEMPCEGDTLAEGIAVKQPGEFTFEIIRDYVDEILLVGEADLERAVSLLLQIEKTVVEGAGAAGFAAMLAHPDRFKGRKVGLILCGGNIDTHLLANVLLRDLARQGRLARLRVRIKDHPGALSKVAHVFEEQEANIIEVSHQRIFTKLPAKGLFTEIECETRDRAHLDRLIVALREEGYEVCEMELA